VVVVTSDHGWNMGQKDYLFKNSPWEESCRVPLFIRAPGMMEGGGVAKRPVSLIDLYPTLVDICGLTGDNRKSELGAELSGHSLRPFLENPGTEDWDGPDGALSMIWADLTGPDRWNPDRQHWSLRTQRWRYILYNTGAEELYDHGEDPHEWRNVAGEPRLSDDLSRLRALMHEIRARP
jgi:iduronate 2-sulfatase